jgi:cytochrome P450
MAMEELALRQPDGKGRLREGDFDPFSPEFRADPYRVYADFRERDPVHLTSAKGGSPDQRWLVFRHRDAVLVLTDERFGREKPAKEGRATEAQQASAFSQMVSNWMLFRDPPQHTRLRGAVSRVFTRGRITDLCSRMETLARESIDRIQHAGRADLIGEFAFPLPLEVIAELIGVETGDRRQFKRWSTVLCDAIDMKSDSGWLQRAEEATTALRSFFRNALVERRREPADDLLSSMLAEVGPEALTEDEMFATFTFLISAGHETTTNTIGNGVLALIQNPEQLRLLVRCPELIETAVDEILRYDSPVQVTSRVVHSPVTIDGRELTPGQRVDVMIGSANRDPEVFEHPDKLDVTRDSRAHLAFGLGTHYCLGAPLARLEACSAIGAIVRSLADLRVEDAELEYRENVAFRGLTALNCSFTPARGGDGV